MTKIIYICCPGHSGSTLLDLMLGSHSKVTSLGEISHLPKNIALNTECTCGSVIRSCPVWTKVINEIGKKIDTDIFSNPYAIDYGLPVAVNVVDINHQTSGYLFKRKFILSSVYIKYRYGMDVFGGLNQIYSKIVNNNFVLYDVVNTVRGTEVVVDSSKSYLKGIALYLSHPENVRIILLTRDGRGVMYSNMKRNNSRRFSLNGWKKYYTRALPLLSKHVPSKNLLRVRYEDLIANTETELQRICRFINVEYEADMVNFSQHEHHITNGNNMRFRKEQKVVMDKSWADNLSSDDLAYFRKQAGKLNAMFGYV